jgi:hypothetical protein
MREWRKVKDMFSPDREVKMEIGGRVRQLMTGWLVI